MKEAPQASGFLPMKWDDVALQDVVRVIHKVETVAWHGALHVTDT